MMPDLASGREIKRVKMSFSVASFLKWTKILLQIVAIFKIFSSGLSL